MPCSAEPELIDLPGQDPELLAANLRDLRRVNRLLGGSSLTLRGIRRIMKDFNPARRFSLLDVATGTADIPRSVAAWAAKRGIPARLVGVDLNLTILAEARDGPASPVALAVADALRLPFPDDSVDVVTCSLVLHHFDPPLAVTLLREMARVAQSGVVVNDLVRGRLGYVGAIALTRLFTRNPLTRHDAPLSVLRAYTRDEMARLAMQAGLGTVTFLGFFGYRVAMVATLR